MKKTLYVLIPMILLSIGLVSATSTFFDFENCDNLTDCNLNETTFIGDTSDVNITTFNGNKVLWFNEKLTGGDAYTLGFLDIPTNVTKLEFDMRPVGGVGNWNFYFRVNKTRIYGDVYTGLWYGNDWGANTQRLGYRFDGGSNQETLLVSPQNNRWNHITVIFNYTNQSLHFTNNYTIGDMNEWSSDASQVGNLGNVSYLGAYTSENPQSYFDNINFSNSTAEAPSPPAVDDAPTSTITTPSDGDNYTVQWADFSLIGTDPENTTLTGKLYINGTLNATNNTLLNNTAWTINVTGFEWSYYQAILEVCDYQNCTNSSTTGFTMIEPSPPSNNAPTSTITLPTNGYNTTNNWVYFSLIGTDPENTTLTGKLFINGTLNQTNVTMNNNTAWNMNITGFAINPYNAILQICDYQNCTNSSTTGFEILAVPNTAPNITNWYPTNLTQAIFDIQTLDMNITVNDAENDSLTYIWYVDSVDQNESDETYTFSEGIGTYEVGAWVSDGEYSDNQNWTVTVYATPPYIAQYSGTDIDDVLVDGIMGVLVFILSMAGLIVLFIAIRWVFKTKGN